jgi:hypothetical protein
MHCAAAGGKPALPVNGRRKIKHAAAGLPESST